MQYNSQFLHCGLGFEPSTFSRGVLNMGISADVEDGWCWNGILILTGSAHKQLVKLLDSVFNYTCAKQGIDGAGRLNQIWHDF